jgi:hypothetical protein
METTILIAQALVKYGPEVAEGLARLFEVRKPTLEEWGVVFELARKPYAEYVRGGPGTGK